MMLCSEIIDVLNRLAPQELACDWDNPGFQAGRMKKEVHRVLVALDAADAVIEQAIAEQVDMIITHHPLIFRPLKQVNDQDFISRRIVKMLQNDICYFAMHTNFDAAPGCMADLAARQLGMCVEEPLEITGEVSGEAVGIGKIGTMPTSQTVEELAGLVKEKFELPFVAVYGSKQVCGPVKKIALLPGAGGSMVKEALKKKAEVLITGDIGHHDGIDAAANGMAVIDAGHYGIERIFVPFMQKYLKECFGEQLEILSPEEDFPVKVIL